MARPAAVPVLGLALVLLLVLAAPLRAAGQGLALLAQVEAVGDDAGFGAAVGLDEDGVRLVVGGSVGAEVYNVFPAEDPALELAAELATPDGVSNAAVWGGHVVLQRQANLSRGLRASSALYAAGGDAAGDEWVYSGALDLRNERDSAVRLNERFAAVPVYVSATDPACIVRVAAQNASSGEIDPSTHADLFAAHDTSMTCRGVEVALDPYSDTLLASFYSEGAPEVILYRYRLGAAANGTGGVGAWVHEADLLLPYFDMFPVAREKSVAIHGDVALVGVAADRAVHVYAFDAAADAWGLHSSVQGADAEAGFGKIVALDDDRGFVTCSGAADAPACHYFNASRDAGGAFAGFSRAADIPAPGGRAGFGRSLAARGGLVAVGSGDAAAGEPGAVHLFAAPGSGFGPGDEYSSGGSGGRSATDAPTAAPTDAPTAAGSEPTAAPTGGEGFTDAPVGAGGVSTPAPSTWPTYAPSLAPTDAPTEPPVVASTPRPTPAPSRAPTLRPAGDVFVVPDEDVAATVLGVLLIVLGGVTFMLGAGCLAYICAIGVNALAA